MSAPRPSGGRPVLSAGFRPFFACAAAWAIVALGLSVAMILGHLALPTAYGPLAWHFHELLFGYVAAAIAGFLHQQGCQDRAVVRHYLNGLFRRPAQVDINS